MPSSSHNSSDKAVLNYSQSDTDYLDIVARIKAASAPAEDFDKIIRIYPLSSFYAPATKEEQAAKLLSQNHIEMSQWQACLQVNSRLLALNYTSLTGHYGAAVCATEMGNLSLGQYHHKVLDNFIEAIWRTGSGQSPDKPIFITSTNDLYAFIQLHQMIATGQNLEYVNKLPVQAITVKNPQNNRSDIWYFDVSSQFRRALIDKIEN